MRIGLPAIIALCTVSLASSAAPPWSVIVAAPRTAPERHALDDLRCYVGRVSGVVPRVVTPGAWAKMPAPAVHLVVSSSAGRLSPQGYRIARASVRGVPSVTIGARSAEGLVNGIYGLLRELGFGFYLGSEAIPASLPAMLPRSPVVRDPVFRVRGVLPWYNFLNSPTTWDPVDHRALIDQLVRGGANFVGYHTYDSEPFAAYPDGKGMAWGARLLNTASPIWGTSPMPTSEFAFGTDKLFGDRYFGARTSLDIADPGEAIRREQSVVRDAFAYARRRGVKTCLGFEVTGDPTQAANREVFLKRLNHVLDTYPTLDYVWLWQAETQGTTGYTAGLQAPSSKDPAAGALARYARAWRATFKRAVDRTQGEAGFFRNDEAGKQARALEGARLALYAMLAKNCLARRAAAPRLVISGWGGDERLLSAEYYDGLDKLLPKDVVFASLDHIVPRPRVDGAYHALPRERERWPIPWLECDGDQWHAQPHVHTLEQLARDARQSGSQGFLGIHWRTRDVEEDFAYLTQYAWEPSLTAEAFFADYARRCYGRKLAAPMAAIHSELDKLGYRWVGGGGQAECGTFGWGPGEETKSVALSAIRDRAAGLLPHAGPSAPRLRRLIDSMEWTLQFRKAEVSAVRASALLDQATKDPARRRDLALGAVTSLDVDAMERALRAYARRLTTRGEYGVLATINGKAIVAWRAIRRRALELLGEPDAPDAPRPWRSDSAVLLPRLVTSAFAGRPLELQPIVLGGAKAWLQWRPVGGGKWRTVPVSIQRGWVGSAAVPAAGVQAPGVEIGFSVTSSPGSLSWGPHSVTVYPAARKVAAPPRHAAVPALPSIDLLVRSGERSMADAVWSAVRSADYYRLIRDGVAVAESPATSCPDTPTTTVATYVVEAMRDGKPIARSLPVEFRAPDRPVVDTVRLTARVHSSGVLLSWDALDGPGVVSYVVRRRSEVVAPVLVAEIPADTLGRVRVADTPPGGTWTYEVAARDAHGREGPAATARVGVPAAAPAPASLLLPLTSAPVGVTTEGVVSYGPDGARLDDGSLTVAHRRGIDMDDGLTVSFRFRADSVADMPVLLCHGQWNIEGWFVQILGGRLLIRTAFGDVEGPIVEPGTWYDVKWVYDGARRRLKVNGQWLPQQAGQLAPSSSTRPLVVGQYDAREPRYRFKGVLRDVLIVPDALME